MSGPLNVLFVCSANLCRSPLAEVLLRQAVRDRAADWTVNSAGTHAPSGRPMHPKTVRALTEMGLTPPVDWTSRQLSTELVAAADLVLTATVEHRRRLVAATPAAVRKSFVLAQFVDLLTQSDAPVPPDPAMILTRIAKARALQPNRRPAGFDIGDPVGHGAKRFRRTAEQIQSLVKAISSTIVE